MYHPLFLSYFASPALIHDGEYCVISPVTARCLEELVYHKLKSVVMNKKTYASYVLLRT